MSHAPPMLNKSCAFLFVSVSCAWPLVSVVGACIAAYMVGFGFAVFVREPL
jgi:hypothetical protein